MDGQNIAFEYRYAEGKRDRAPELAAELVRLKVDSIVVAGGAFPIRAAMNAIKTIPIVLTGPGSDPVWAGYVETLARPGGNVTAHAAREGEMDYEKGKKARGLHSNLTSHWSYQLPGAEICRGSAAVAGSCSCLERRSKPIALTSRRTSRPSS